MNNIFEKYDPVLGIEVHIELNTKTKMFCGCANSFGSEPNTNVCPVCLGFPGSMPVVNKKAIESAIRLGLALNCSVAKSSRFARKNYFYPDLSKDYQISQYDEPIVYNGYLDIDLTDCDDLDNFQIPIERAHLEEDAAKNTHIGGATGRIEGSKYSLVDYNRGGVPLIEIVTKPVENTGSNVAKVAKAYVASLRDLVVALGISDAKMEQGSLRADINISLRPKAQKGQDQNSIPFGTRTETKNVNSLKTIELVVETELERQAQLLDQGKKIIQETRHWVNGKTLSGRSKEEAQDYRYFPEPDLMPIVPDKNEVLEFKKTIPEMPALRKKRLQKSWNFTDLEMRDILNANALNLIEETVNGGASANSSKKWWLGTITNIATQKNVSLEKTGVTPQDIIEVEQFISSNKITDKIARTVVESISNGCGKASEIIKKQNLEVVQDTKSLEQQVQQAFDANPEVVEKLKNGQLNVIGVIVGAVMKATGGKANAKIVNQIILEKLNK